MRILLFLLLIPASAIAQKPKQEQRQIAKIEDAKTVGEICDFLRMQVTRMQPQGDGWLVIWELPDSQITVIADRQLRITKWVALDRRKKVSP